MWTRSQARRLQGAGGRTLTVRDPQAPHVVGNGVCLWQALEDPTGARAAAALTPPPEQRGRGHHRLHWGSRRPLHFQPEGWTS